MSFRASVGVGGGDRHVPGGRLTSANVPAGGFSPAGSWGQPSRITVPAMLSRPTILPAYIQNPPPLFSCFHRISPFATVVSRCGARAPFGRIVAPEYALFVLSATVSNMTIGIGLPPRGPPTRVNVPSHTPA